MQDVSGIGPTHYKDANGVWLPIIVDPMGDVSAVPDAERFIAVQKVDRDVLIRHGEPTV